MVALRLEGLVIGRGSRTLAPPLDMTLHGGEALVVTGPNGAGKSTLLRVLAGLVPRMAGHIGLQGITAPDGEAATDTRQICHYIGHRNGLKPHQSVAGNLDFWRRYLGEERPQAIEEALAALDLAPLAATPAGYLSAGQQRRAALCRLLAAPRPLWLLDEPATALDTASRNRLATVMERHLADGGMIVAATHQPLGIALFRELELALPAGAPALAEPSGDWEW